MLDSRGMKTSIKLVGIIAGAIMVVGILLVGMQYFAGFSGGVSADVMEGDLPVEIAVSKEDYIKARRLMQEYADKNDLARKNLVFQELSDLVDSWAEQ